MSTLRGLYPNLENVIKAMKEQAEVGNSAFFSGLGIWGAAAKAYKSIEEIKADEARLERLTDEEYSQIKTDFGNRLSEIAESIMNKRESNYFIALDNAMECIIEAARDSKTRSGLLKNLKSYTHLNVTETTVSDIVDLVRDISNMPTTYFEAKPQRAVGFDEIAAVIMPKGDSAELIEVRAELEKLGIPVKEYTAGDDAERAEALNSIEDVAGPVKFQAKKVDKGGRAWDNVSRANKEGDLINEYHGALTREQWRQFYDNLAEDGLLQETEIGTVAPIRVGNKIIVAERKMRGKDTHDFMVDDVFMVTSDNDIDDILDHVNNIIQRRGGEYDKTEIARLVNDFLGYYDGNAVFTAYDRSSGRFITDFASRSISRVPEKVSGNSREEAVREGVSSGNQQDIQTDEGLKPTKFQRKSLDALSDSELLARHLEENSEAVGEILRRTADIEINPRVLNLLVNKKLKEYGISKEGRESVADVVPLLLDSAKITAVKGVDKQKHRRLRLNHPSFMKRQNQQRLLQNPLLLLTILSLPTNSSLPKKLCKGSHLS